jgi:PKD repeat protein
VQEYVVHWGDGSSTSYATAGVKTHTYADGPATHAVTVDLVDEDGTFLDRANDLSVQVENVAPLVTGPANQTATEGTSSSFALGSFTDPGDDDPWQVTVVWGDGSPNTVFTQSSPGSIAAQSHTYADDGPYTASVTVAEDTGTGASGSATFQVTVANVAPVVTPPANQGASEGTSSSFALGSFTDPGDDDPWRVTVAWGDGSPDSVFPAASAGTIAAQTHTYADDGAYTVSVTVTEDGGTGASGSATFQVTVANVSPAVTAPANQTATEGTSKTFDLGSFTDPGDDDPWRVTVDWGDSSADAVFTQATAGPIADQVHTYADDGTYTVTITVEEESGTGPGSGIATFQVTVANVAPMVAKPFFQPTLVGCQSAVTLKGISFSDPGLNDDPWSVDIDWGDGSGHFTYTTATQGAQPDRTHTYATPGMFTATVSVTDKDGDTGSNTSTTAVTVFQYSVDFLPPFDDSTPSGLIVNKMKNGRVVPVKVRITDLCSGSDVTGPGPVVTIKVTKTSGSGASDPIETYADAGESSAGTNEFRPADGFWIYNLDSKALGLVVDNMYRVDVYVNGVKATISNWAVLQPVK